MMRGNFCALQEHEYGALQKSIAILQTTCEQLEGKSASYCKPTTIATQTQEALTHIATTATQTGLSLNSCRLCASKPCCAGTNTEIVAEGAGSLPAIIAFYEELTKNSPLIDCARCQITQTHAQNYALRTTFSLLSVEKKTLQPRTAEGLGG